jgi:hypothetical protein
LSLCTEIWVSVKNFENIFIFEKNAKNNDFDLKYTTHYPCIKM